MTSRQGHRLREVVAIECLLLGCQLKRKCLKEGDLPSLSNPHGHSVKNYCLSREIKESRPEWA